MRERGNTWYLKYPWAVAAVLLIVGANVWLQAHLFLITDDCWLLQCAQKWLAGGHYASDFVETNPPLIIFLNAGVVQIAHFLGLNVLWTFRGAVYLLVCACLGMSYWVSRARPINFYTKLSWVLLLTLLLFYPAGQFAQREHLFLLLILPYLFSVWQRGCGESYAWPTALCVGLLAAVGLAIKFYFYAVFVMVELWLVINLRSLRSLRRLEVMVIVVFALGYLGSVFWLTPTYFKVIVPMARRLYGDIASGSRFFAILTSGASLLIVVPPLVAILVRRVSTVPRLWSLLSVTTLGCLFSCALSGRLWFYHLLPAFILSNFLIWLVFLDLLSDNSQRLGVWLRMLIYILFMSVAFVSTSYVAFRTGFYYNIYNDPASTTNRLIADAKQHAGRSGLYLMSMGRLPLRILSFYSHVKSASRFAAMWPLAGILWKPDYNRRCRQDILFVVNAVNQDFMRYRPGLVFVDEKPYKAYVPKGVNFTYLSFLQQHSLVFRDIWSHYRLVKRIGDYNVYKKQS